MLPVEEKGALVEALREAVLDLKAFCAARDVDLDALGRLQGFEMVAAGKQTVELLIADDDEKIAFVSRAALVNRLYKAILPDKRANEFSRVTPLSKVLADTIASDTERADISGVDGPHRTASGRVRCRSGVPDPRGADAEALFDLASVDWKGLEEVFKNGTPAHGCPAPAGAGVGAYHGARSAQPFAGSIWSSGSRSSWPTTTLGASTPN